jgi:hypothetical protein
MIETTDIVTLDVMNQIISYYTSHSGGGHRSSFIVAQPSPATSTSRQVSDAFIYPGKLGWSEICYVAESTSHLGQNSLSR